MSTRESFLISPIKSIQRGSVTATNGTTGTITVTSVDTSKSVLHSSVKSGTVTHSGTGVIGSGAVGSIKLTNATTITWTGADITSLTSNSNSVIEWQLVEYK